MRRVDASGPDGLGKSEVSQAGSVVSVGDVVCGGRESRAFMIESASWSAFWAAPESECASNVPNVLTFCGFGV
jgi:hypothetical protein